MLNRLLGLTLTIYLLVFVAFFLVKADGFLGYQGLLPVAPFALFLALSLPVVFGTVLVSLRVNHLVSLFHRCRAVLIPFAAMLFTGLCGAIVRLGGPPTDSRVLFYSIVSLYVFFAGVLIGGVIPVRRLWHLAMIGALAIATGTIFIDVVRPYTFTLPELVGPAGLAQNPNSGAIVTILILAVVLDWRKRETSAVDLMILAVALSAVFVTGSRSGLLTAAAVGMFYLYRVRWSLIRFRTLAGLSLVVILAGLGLWVSRFDLLNSFQAFVASSRKLNELFDPTSGIRTLSDKSSLNRIAAIDMSLPWIAKSPFIGMGTGFSYEMAVGPHNMYLARWVDNGILGLAAYLWFLAAAIWVNRKHKNLEGVVIASIMVMYGLFSHNILEERTFLLLLAISTARGAVFAAHPSIRPKAVKKRAGRGAFAQTT